MRPDDVTRHRKSDAGADAHGFGGEIGIEDALPEVLRHARSVVGEADEGHARRRPPRLDAEEARRVDPRHRLLGVDQQVGDHLRELVGIRIDHRRLRREGGADLDARCPQPVDRDRERRFDDPGEGDRRAVGRLLACHREEGLHDPSAAIGGGVDAFRALFRRGRVGGFLEQRRLRDHDRERVVEFMRHAGQQRAHGGHLLGLMQLLALLVEFLLLGAGVGEVAQMRGEDPASAGVDLVDGQFDRNERAVLAQALDLDAPPDDMRHAAGEIALHAAGMRGAGCCRHDQIAHGAADRLLRTVAEHGFGGRVEFERQPLVIHDDNAVERGDDDGAMQRLAGGQRLYVLGGIKLGVLEFGQIAGEGEEARLVLVKRLERQDGNLQETPPAIIILDPAFKAGHLPPPDLRREAHIFMLDVLAEHLLDGLSRKLIEREADEIEEFPVGVTVDVVVVDIDRPEWNAVDHRPELVDMRLPVLGGGAHLVGEHAPSGGHNGRGFRFSARFGGDVAHQTGGGADHLVLEQQQHDRQRRENTGQREGVGDDRLQRAATDFRIGRHGDDAPRRPLNGGDDDILSVNHAVEAGVQPGCQLLRQEGDALRRQTEA